MLPKKSKELIPQVATELNLPIGLVEAVTTQFWIDVSEAMTSLENIKIHVSGLGDFQIKHWLLDNEIRKCENFNETTRLRGRQRYAAGIKMEEKHQLLLRLKEQLTAEQQRKEFIKQHKTTAHEVDTYTPDSLEQEIPNS